MALLLAVAPALPGDVRLFVARYESCRHWLGEDGYDADRAREIAAAVRAECPGIDRARARLIRRHRASPRVRRRLGTLEPLGY